MTPIAPASLDALAETIAASAPAPLTVRGAGTKARPAPGSTTIDMRALSGLVAYDPAECVVSVRAGTPVADLAAMLAPHGQYLPWDPPLAAVGATVGGMIASGWNGPGRYRYGGMRDFVTGVRVVDGAGRVVTSGGQVVKNAAGFLLHHALVGSHGRLGVVAEVSLKVFPAPESTTTLIATFASHVAALAAHERVRLCGLELDALDLAGPTLTLLARLAGAAEGMPARVDRACRAMSVAAEVLAGDDQRAAWERHTLRPTADAPLVKVPATPSRLAGLIAACDALAAWHVSCGGAAIYLRPTASLDAVHDVVTRLDARGVIIAGPSTGRFVGRPSVSPFADRVRATLDPHGRFR